MPLGLTDPKEMGKSRDEIPSRASRASRVSRSRVYDRRSVCVRAACINPRLKLREPDAIIISEGAEGAIKRSRRERCGELRFCRHFSRRAPFSISSSPSLPLSRSLFLSRFIRAYKIYIKGIRWTFQPCAVFPREEGRCRRARWKKE